MPYLMIDDFAAGMDLRKSAITAPAGTLRRLKNATITAGGEIEKRKTLTNIGTLPPGTSFGLGFINNTLVVFGTLAPASVGTLPPNVIYQQLAAVTAAPIDRVLDVQVFTGQIYAIVRFTNGVVQHYYNGAAVADTSARGLSVRAHKTKLYATDGSNLRFSGVRTPTNWSTGTGAGILDVTEEDAGETALIGLEEYFGALALFGRTSVQIWDMDPNPASNTLRQVLGNTGLVAQNAVARFGSGDVLYLADTGIRSLRARDIQSAAAVNDIGAPVDNYVQPKRADLTPALADKLAAVVDPLTGQFWMVWDQEALVLTAYPNSKISAWAVYDFGVPVDYIVRANSRLAIRSGDELFVYGSVPPTGNPFDPNTPIGTTAALYDDTVAEFVTPFMDAGRPATSKNWAGLDATVTGTWDVYVCPSPPDPDAVDQEPVWTQIGSLSGPTWNKGRVPIEMEGTHIAVRMVSVGTGPATVSSVALHHDLGEDS